MSTGMTRKVDDLGRIVIPIEIRKNLNINENDSVEIFVDGPSIILKKYETSCIFCKNTKKLTTYKGKHICTRCLNNILKTEE